MAGQSFCSSLPIPTLVVIIAWFSLAAVLLLAVAIPLITAVTVAIAVAITVATGITAIVTGAVTVAVTVAVICIVVTAPIIRTCRGGVNSSVAVMRVLCICPPLPAHILHATAVDAINATNVVAATYAHVA